MIKMNKKLFFSSVFVILVLCVVLVMGAAVFVQILPTSDTTENSYAELEWNFTMDDSSPPNEVKLHWNGTNTTIYDDSVVLIMNFDNRSALGENDTHVVDISGNGNNGTVTGATFNSTGGKYNGAFEFDGSSNKITTDSTGSLLAGEDEISISAWVKRAGGGQVIAGRIAGASNSHEGFGIIQDAGNAQCVFGNGTDVYQRLHSVGDVLIVGEWVQITCVLNSTNRIMYVNGIENNRNIFSGSVVSTSWDFIIGGRGDTWGGQYFNGSIDDVNVWNKSLSNNEVLELYKSEISRYTTDEWSLYSNQTNLTTNATGISYDYYICVKNSSDYENCSEERIITKIPESVTITGNFTSSIGNVDANFYGAAVGNPFTLDHLTYGVDSEWRKNAWLESGMKIQKIDSQLNHFYSNTTDSSGVNFTGNLTKVIINIEWAKDNNIKTLVIAESTPNWLSDNSSGLCSNINQCPPKNFTQLANIFVDYYNRIGCDADNCEVEVWNEPYGSFMGLDTYDSINKALNYTEIYSEMQRIIKLNDSNIKVGGPSGFRIAPNMTYTFLTNISSSKRDFISIHPYGYDRVNGLNQLEDIENLYALCSTLGVSCGDKIYLSEWNIGSKELTNLTYGFNEYEQSFAQSYISLLNNYPENISNIIHDWTSNSNYSGSGYKYEMVSSPTYNNSYAPTYNVTKNFATYHSAGSTVYTSSSSSSAVKTVSSLNSQNYYITVINTDTEARNITINTSGNLTELYNLKTGENFSSETGVFEVGVVDSYEILYFGYLGDSSYEFYCSFSEKPADTGCVCPDGGSVNSFGYCSYPAGYLGSINSPVSNLPVVPVDVSIVDNFEEIIDSAVNTTVRTVENVGEAVSEASGIQMSHFALGAVVIVIFILILQARGKGVRK